jgi:uncharacterized protein (TIGR03437 family)
VRVCLALAAVECSGLAQGTLPTSAFRELLFVDAEITGPQILCPADPIPNVGVPDVASQPFLVKCGGHEIRGTLQISVPSFLPEGTTRPGQAPDFQLSSPVNVSARLDETWVFSSQGYGWLDADVTIGLESLPDGSLKCATSDPSVQVPEDSASAQASASLSCSVGAVFVAPPELGLPPDSLLLPLIFHYGWTPSVFHPDHPPDAGGGITAYAVYGGPVAAGADVSLAAIEVVQAVQTAPPAMVPANADPARRVPLIALKSSMLRVYVRDAQKAEDGVLIKVQGRRNGVLLAGSPLTVGPVRPGNPDRSTAGGSVNVPLPLFWTEEGELELTAEVSLFGSAVDPKTDNNSVRETFQFFRTAAAGVLLDVYYAPVCYQPGGVGNVYCPDDNTDGTGARLPISQFAAFAAKLYPLPDFAFNYRRLPLGPIVFKEQLTRKTSHHLLPWLRVLYNHIDVARRGRVDQLVFWVPPRVTTDTKGILGIADAKWSTNSASGRIAWSANNSEKDAFDPQRTLVHEVAHNLGLRHTNTENGCGAKDDNTDWPRKGETLLDLWVTSGDSRIGEPGFDPIAAQFQPSGRMDFMSYCTPSAKPPNNQEAWVSPYHYKKLFENCFQSFANDGTISNTCMQGKKIAYVQGAPLTAGPRQLADADYLIVSGSVNADGSSGSLDPVFRVSSATPPDPIGSEGDYCLIVSGAAGQLAKHCFTPDFLDPETREPVPEDLFSVRIPAPAGATRIALTHDGQELAAVQASASAPQLDITSPHTGDRWDGGTQAVRWNSSDADGDARTYAVHYSPDGGGVWLPLDIDMQQTQLEVDPSKIEGGDDVMIRVLASDGFNTTDRRVGPIRVVQTPRLEAVNQLDLHNALVGQTVERTLAVRNSGTGPLTINSATSSNSVVAVITSLPLVLGAGESGVIRLRFTPASVGTQSGTLTLQSTDAQRPSVQVGFQGKGVSVATPDLVPALAALDFGAVDVGQSAERALPLENFGPAAVTITAIELSGGAFTVQSQTTPYELGVRRDSMTVTFMPPGAGSFSGRVTIRTNAPAQPVIEVTLNGTGVAAGGGGPRPAINRGGIVDAASFAATLARGGIGSIFGVDLAPGVDVASATPLPQSLNGVRVLVNNQAAPLFFVSSTQINFQIPYEVPASGQVNIVVERNGVVSTPEPAQVALNAPAMFTNPSNGEPIVERYPNFDLITANNPARSGDVLILFLTGIGDLTSRPASGSAAPSSPLATAVSNPTVTVGSRNATVFFAGLAPGFVGLGQINIQLPQFSAVTAGPGQSAGTLPLVIRFDDRSSRSVNLPMADTAGSGNDISVSLESVLPRQAVIQDHLVVDYTVHKPSGVSGPATRRVFLSTDASVDSHDVLLDERDIELQDTGDEALTASGIVLLDIFTPRTYYVAVEVEFPGDPNSANNFSAALPFEIVAQRPAFDAAIQLQQITPQQAGPGDSLTLSYAIAAADHLTATLQRSIYLSPDAAISGSDTLINTRTVDIVEGSAEVDSANNYIPRETPPGDYFVGIILEQDGDRNPGDNVSAAFPVHVSAERIPFEIGVQISDVQPRQVAAGGALTVNYSIQNNSQASGIYTRELRLSQDATITSADVLINTRTFTLAGDAPNLVSQDNVVPANTPPGAYFVGVIVEMAGDTNAANNGSPSPIAITVTASSAALRWKPAASVTDENPTADGPSRPQPSVEESRDLGVQQRQFGRNAVDLP